MYYNSIGINHWGRSIMKKLLFGGALCAMLSTGAFGGNCGLDSVQSNAVQDQKLSQCKKTFEREHQTVLKEVCSNGGDKKSLYVTKTKAIQKTYNECSNNAPLDGEVMTAIKQFSKEKNALESACQMFQNFEVNE